MSATTEIDPASARRNSMIETIIIGISAMVISPFRSRVESIPSILSEDPEDGLTQVSTPLVVWDISHGAHGAA